MRPIHYGIFFLLSVLLASISLFSPWAEAVYQIGKGNAILVGQQVEATNEQTTLLIFVWDKFLADRSGCPRGLVEGLDYYLDGWVWIGRTVFICQTCLWLTFLFGTAFRKGFKIVTIWSAGLTILFFLFFLASNPIIECQYTQLPPPLIFKQWHVSVTSVLLSLANLLFSIWINVSIYKIPLKQKAG